MRDIFEIVRDRHSSRAPFEAKRCASKHDLLQILEAARWAPTAHNMQNFEIILIDDKATLAAIAAIRAAPSDIFIRENYAQLSFSEGELLQKKTGLLASMFPASWRNPDAKPQDVTELDIRFSEAPCRTARLYWSSSTTRGNGRQLPKGIRLES